MQRQELIAALSASMTRTMLRTLGSIAQISEMELKQEVAIRGILGDIQKEVVTMLDEVSVESLTLLVESAKIQEKLIDNQDVVELSFRIGDRIYNMLSNLGNFD